MDLRQIEVQLTGDGSQLEKLVEELDTLFPAFLPSPSESDRLIMYRAGQRSVVEHLMRQIKKE